MTRIVGALIEDGHTVTRWPWLSKVSDEHSDGGSAPRRVCRLRPVGPACEYVSVIHGSLWMLPNGFGAMFGFCGGRGSGIDDWAWAAGAAISVGAMVRSASRRVNIRPKAPRSSGRARAC